jgi:hypothetical protein
MPNSNLLKLDFFPNEEILSHAKEFGNLCKEIQGLGRFTIPYIVNATFTIELYLKCLHAQQVYSNKWDARNYSESHVRSPTHSPHELYEKLPESKRSWLSALHCEFFDNRNANLYDELKCFHRVFIDWRYLFEGNAGTVPLSLLKELLRFFEFASSPEAISKYKAS